MLWEIICVNIHVSIHLNLCLKRMTWGKTSSRDSEPIRKKREFSFSPLHVSRFQNKVSQTLSPSSLQLSRSSSWWKNRRIRKTFMFYNGALFPIQHFFLFCRWGFFFRRAALVPEFLFACFHGAHNDETDIKGVGRGNFIYRLCLNCKFAVTNNNSGSTSPLTRPPAHLVLLLLMFIYSTHELQRNWSCLALRERLGFLGGANARRACLHEDWAYTGK